jgi:hypothetical protein
MLVNNKTMKENNMNKYKMLVICGGSYNGGGEPIEAENAKSALAIAVESELDVIKTMRAECPEAFEVEVTVTNESDEEDTASQTLAIQSMAELELEEAESENGEEVASVTEGKKYGYVPGNRYHNVKVDIEKLASDWRVRVTETFGSCQGNCNFEEDCRNIVVCVSSNLEDAVDTAQKKADKAGIARIYSEKALAQAQSKVLTTNEV